MELKPGLHVISPDVIISLVSGEINEIERSHVVDMMEAMYVMECESFEKNGQKGRSGASVDNGNEWNESVESWGCRA